MSKPTVQSESIKRFLEKKKAEEAARGKYFYYLEFISIGILLGDLICYSIVNIPPFFPPEKMYEQICFKLD